MKGIQAETDSLERKGRLVARGTPDAEDMLDAGESRVERETRVVQETEKEKKLMFHIGFLSNLHMSY